MFKQLFVSLMAALFVAGGLGLAGCNTMEGIGKDIQVGGQELREEANARR